MYNLKSTSLSSRFYSWIWNTEISNFKTMCPYFWSYVLTIIFLPLILIIKGLVSLLPKSKKVDKALDYVAGSKFGDLASKIFKPSRFRDFLGSACKWVFFIFVGAFILFMLYAIGFAVYKDPFGVILVVFSVVGGASILILIVYLFSEYDLFSKIAYPFKLFGNMIYSLYKNMCPLIKWENK